MYMYVCISTSSYIAPHPISLIGYRAFCCTYITRVFLPSRNTCMLNDDVLQWTRDDPLIIYSVSLLKNT